MNITTEHANGIAVVRVGESRLMYPLLSEFSSAVQKLIASGERRVVIDLSSVGYVDSATIGCLMDLYRQANAAGGALKLAGVQKLIASGERRVVIDLSSVGYVDSATIGCLMDLYRQANAAGGALKLAGVQKRVETMLTMTGAQNFIEVHPDEPTAVKSFGA